MDSVLQLDNIKILPGTDKKVVSTALFIPFEGCNVAKDDYKRHFDAHVNKAFNYFTGLIRSTSLFQNIMGLDWIYRIYVDEQFINPKLSYADPIYDINEESINDTEESTYERYVKSMIKHERVMMIKLHTMYKEVLSIISKYNYVEIISFSSPKFTKMLKHKNYLGYPQTFGSIVRFFSIYDPNVAASFFVNISHAITPKMAHFIKEFERSKYTGTSLCSLKAYNFTGDDGTLNETQLRAANMLGIDLDKITHRLPAGVTGIKRDSKSLIPDSLTVLIDKIRIMFDCIDLDTKNLDIFPYGIDEILLSYIVNPRSKEFDITNFDNIDIPTNISLNFTEKPNNFKLELELVIYEKAMQYYRNQYHIIEFLMEKMEKLLKNESDMVLLRLYVMTLKHIETLIGKSSELSKCMYNYFENIIKRNPHYHRFVSRNIFKICGISSSYIRYNNFNTFMMNHFEDKPLKLTNMEIPTLENSMLEMYILHRIEACFYTYISIHDPDCLKKILKHLNV